MMAVKDFQGRVVIPRLVIEYAYKLNRSLPFMKFCTKVTRTEIVIQAPNKPSLTKAELIVKIGILSGEYLDEGMFFQKLEEAGYAWSGIGKKLVPEE